MSTGRPLDRVTSIKVKLGLLVAASVLTAAVVAAAGAGADLPWWTTLPVTVAAALGVTQWLARGMTAPLRQMTAAARRMAAGDYGQRVTVTSGDEVGELARTFNAMAGDLASADLERRRLVATVSHELRTPLTAQRALLENLADGVVSPDADTLGAALGQAERLSALVDDLLDLSRIDAGVAPLRLAEVSVADVLRRAADEAALGPRGADPSTSPRLRVRVDPEDLRVTADRDRLAQLVANLVDNAVRHSPAGGAVRLEAAATGDTWTLEVRDDGPGIPAADAHRVFERFGTGSDAAGGTGLGLAIVRWVCELHGGRVEAVPTPPGGSGALLRVTLPTTPRPDRPTHVREEIVMTSPTAPAAPRPPEGSGSGPVLTAPSRPDDSGGAGPSPTDASGGAGPSEPVVERFWPEPDGRARPGILAAATGIAAFAALTWIGAGVGLSVSLVLLGAGALMWVVARHRTDPWTVSCGVLALLLVAVPTVRDAGGVVTLAVLVAVAATVAGVTRARGVTAMVVSGLAWPLSAVRGLPLLGRTLQAASRFPAVVPALRTALVTVVLVVVFGGLFATGDAVFGSWAQALVPDLRWDTIVGRTFVFVLVGGVTLTGAYLALNPPAVGLAALPPSTRVRPVWEWAVPVGVVVALFGGFLLAQATALFGGDDYLRRTTGLTHAEYVHQGFGQLTTATALTVVVMAVTLRVAAREDARQRLVVRVLLLLLGLLTLAVVASALSRMALYQEAFGYTVLRVFVDGFEIWLGLVVLVLMGAVLAMRWDWVPRAVLVSSTVFALGFAAMNPDAWVADRNIDRYEAGAVLDTQYLASLSADATPVIAARLPATMARCIVDGYSGRPPQDDWLSFNLGRFRAADAETMLPPEVPGGGRSSECSPYLSDSYGG